MFEIFDSLKDFKFVLLNPKDSAKTQKDQNLNSISLKTEQSDDLNEFMKENNFIPKNKIKTNKIKLIEVINIDKLRTPTKLELKKQKSSLDKYIIDNSILLELNSHKSEDNNLIKRLSNKVKIF